MRICRRGNVFTSLYRTATTAWTELYRYEDVNGSYGDTVYVGPVTSYLALTDEQWATSLHAKAYYSWRFSEVELRPFTGLRFILR